MVRRLKKICICISVVMVLLAVRLYYIQIVQHDNYQNMAELQWRMKISFVTKAGNKPLPRDSQGNTFFYCIPRERIDDRAKRVITVLDGKNVSPTNQTYLIIASGNYDDLVNKLLKDSYGSYTFALNRETIQYRNSVDYYVYGDCRGLILGDSGLKAGF